MKALRVCVAVLVLACASLSTPVLGSSGFNASEVDMTISPRTQAVLELDRVYQETQRVLHPNDTRIESSLLSGSYNKDVAMKMFWHSVTAYCLDNKVLQGWGCKSCKQFGDFTLTQIMDDKVNQGYVGYFKQNLPASPLPGTPVAANEPFVVVSFRGTVPSKVKDWVEDLNFPHKHAYNKFHHVNVHRGFWKAYDSLSSQMVQGIQAALKASGARAVIFTGHSLGAAMAELAAVDVKLDKFPSVYVGTYTQGAPRVGDKSFAKLFANTISVNFRETHAADVVPHLPPEFLHFRHPPTEVFWNRHFDGFRVCSTNDGEDKTCADHETLPINVAEHLTYHGVAVGGYCD